MFTREVANRKAADFKYKFNDAIAYADETQESVALKVGVTQGQMNNWCNPNSDRNFPMALFPLLPSRMQHFLYKELNPSENNSTWFNLNGNIDDEIVALVQLESELKKKSEADSKGAQKILLQMRVMIDRAEKEIERMHEVK